MSAFELLSNYDKEILQKYIFKYGPTEHAAQLHDNWKGLETVLEEWNAEKEKYLLKLFDNQLILSRPYSYMAQQEAMSIEIGKHFHDPQPTAFFNWFERAVRTVGNDIEIYDFNGNNLANDSLRYYSKWYEVRDCLTPLTLASNAYLGKEVIIEFKESGHRMKMFRGMKPMKILHTVVKEFDGPEDIFDAFRIWHSMQLNQKRMDGELCLSIHPMDYITMSDNNNGWKSCMRWTDNNNCFGHGDYRSGTVQCMNSPYIVIAYLHNKKHQFYPFSDEEEYSWNSKQWRELFIVQDGVINEIKGYPFQDENLTQASLMWIKELAEKNLGWTYEDEEVDVSKEVKPNVYLSFDAGTNMYKDIGTLDKHSGRINIEKLKIGKYYTQEFASPKKDTVETFITIPYGGNVTCMCCGKDFYMEEGSIVFCDRCESLPRCAICGNPIDSDDVYYVEELDEPICYNCYSDECGCDDFDDQTTHLIENMEEIRLLLGYDRYGTPIFYEDRAYTYRPADNWAFQDVFMELPKTYNGNLYVTYDMVNQAEIRTFYDAFGIWPRDWDRFYESIVRDYDIDYDWNNQDLDDRS